MTASMICPLCARRYAGTIDADCPVCLGAGTLTVTGDHLGETDPRTAARSVQMYLTTANDHPSATRSVTHSVNELVDAGLIRRLEAVTPLPAEVRTLQAAARPCELYAEHRPAVVRTQGHHIFPEYLQRRLYGRTTRPDIAWVCGNCHDAIHELISFRLGEARQPNPMPGRKVTRFVGPVIDWYRSEAARLGLQL